MDMVYAIVIWRVFMLLPRPDPGHGTWKSLSAMLMSNIESVALVAISLVIIITYWIQNNRLYGSLKATDTKHTALSIFQLFLLMVFLYSLRMGVVFEGALGTKVLESLSAAALGLSSMGAWAYAIGRGGLLSDRVTLQGAKMMQDRYLAEPLAALLTIPCAFIGPAAWEVAWLSFIPLAWLLRRRRRRLNHATTGKA